MTKPEPSDLCDMYGSAVPESRPRVVSSEESRANVEEQLSRCLEAEVPHEFMMHFFVGVTEPADRERQEYIDADGWLGLRGIDTLLENRC